MIYNSFVRLSNFTIGVQGLKASDVTLMKDTIMNVLRNIREQGVPKDRVEGLLHQFELSLKHRTGQFGLGLGQSVMGQWMHERDPIEALDIAHHLALLQHKIHEKGDAFFADLIDRYFLNNPQQCLFVMNPDDSYQVEWNKKEAKKLNEKLNSLTSQDKENIYNQNLELLKMQDQQEDLACLPTLKVKDISLIQRTYPLSYLDSQRGKIYCRETKTNQVAYFSIGHSIRGLPDNLVPYLPIFCNVMFVNFLIII
jgi:Zn-dependent M16 (insulinase) family peptidase